MTFQSSWRAPLWVLAGSTGLLSGLIYGEEPKPTAASATVDAGNRPTLPEKIVVDKALQYQLPVVAGRFKPSFRIVDAPQGVAISPAGLLSWTPTKGDLGPQSIKIRLQVGDQISLVKLTTVVVTPEAQALDPASQGKFVKLGGESAVTSMEVSEDGLYFAAAHAKDRKLSIWDAKTAQVIKTLEGVSPSCLLWRGGRLYVGHYGKGSISIYDPAKDWELADELKVGIDGVYHLSAPQGKFFQGQLLVTCLIDGISQSQVVVLVDVNEDRQEELFRATYITVATVDYEGRYMFMQGHEGTPMMSVGAVYDFGLILKYQQIVRERKVALDPEAARAEKAKYFTPLGAGEHDNAPFLFQAWPGLYWLGGPALFRGVPPRRQSAALGMYLIHDQTRKLLYALDTTLLRCLDPNRNFAEIGKQSVDQSPIYTGRPRAPVTPQLLPDFPWNYFVRAFAVTHDPFVMIYFHDRSQKAILHCRLDAFKQPVDVAPVDSPDKQVVGAPVNGPSSPGKHVLDGAKPFLTYGHDGASVLLLDNSTLSILDADGQTVKSSRTLSKAYKQIYERPDYLVAFQTTAIDLLNKQTLEVQKTMELPKPNEIVMMAPHPGRKITYVSGSASSSCLSLYDETFVLQVDETAGTVTKLPKVFGTLIGIDPSGRYLYGTIGNAWGPLSAASGLASTMRDDYPDIVITHELSRRIPLAVALTAKTGSGGSRIVFSPDGRQVVPLSWISLRENPGCINSFELGRLEQPTIMYSLKWSPLLDCTFHPTIGLFAAINSKDLKIFDRATGAEVTDRLPEGKVFNSIRGVMFSPGGKPLLVVHKDPQQGLVVESVPLKLQPEEENQVAKGFEPPQPVAAGPDWEIPHVDPYPVRLPLEKLEALRPAAGGAVAERDISNRYGTAFVKVDCGAKESGGVVVGSSGYVLTKAELFMLFCPPTVTYVANRSGKTETLQAKATIVRFDGMKGLALLKIEPDVPLTTVTFAQSATFVADEGLMTFGVTIVPPLPTANPILEHVHVTNASRKLGDSTFIELYRSGGSGRPVFNKQGQMVAMGTLNSRFANGPLATPVAELRAFLEADLSGSNAAPIVEGLRVWADATGQFQVEAELVRVEGGNVVLKRKSGETISVPLARLSEKDRVYLKSREKP